MTIDCPPGFGIRWNGPVAVDGEAWPLQSGDTVWLPVGKHTVTRGGATTPLHIVGFNGTLLRARWTGFTAELEYESESRAAALVDQSPGGAWVDGKEALTLQAGSHVTLLLPRGRHKVVIQAPKPQTRPTTSVE